MKEMKFRAWSLSKKKMLDRVLAGPGDPCSIVWDEDREEWLNFDNACGVIMQFTGLTDKNGKDIYDGDIVQSDRGLFEVFWRDGFAGFYLRKVDEPGWIDLISMTGNVTWCEVVGNIYEHRDLTHDQA